MLLAIVHVCYIIMYALRARASKRAASMVDNNDGCDETRPHVHVHAQFMRSNLYQQEFKIMSSLEKVDLPDPSPPQPKKIKLEAEREEDDGTAAVMKDTHQLVNRKWAKIEKAEQKNDELLFRVMQWNCLADGEHYPSYMFTKMFLAYSR